MSVADDSTTTTASHGPGRSALGVAAFFAVAPAAAAGGGLLLAPLQTAAALLAAPTRWPPALVSAILWPAAALLAFAGFVALSCLWSVEPRWDSAVKIITIVAAGLVFTAAAGAASVRGRAAIAAAGAAACLCLIGLLAVETLLNMPLNRLAQPDAEAGALARNPGKGVSVLMVLVWGVIAAYGGAGGWRSKLALGVLAAAFALSPQFDMNANLIGLAFGLLVYGVAQLAPAFALGAVAGGLALWMLAAPFLTPVLMLFPQLVERLPLSWQMRLEIWRFAEARIMERPIVGWGLDGARSFRGELSQIGGQPFPSLPLHPHSASLHVWLETGAIGAGLAAAAILAVGAAAAQALKADRHRLAAAAAAMATVGVIWNVSYGAWQEWWMVMPFAVAALIIAGRQATASNP